ncbi:hypothetical protein Q3G72_024379 [Acer saccharum]|nr:hypothetical protein Q3G72_024379 [Acer saccharum]
MPKAGPDDMASRQPTPSRNVAVAPQGQHPRRTTSKPTTQPIRFLRHPRRLVACFLLQSRRHAAPSHSYTAESALTSQERFNFVEKVSVDI